MDYEDFKKLEARVSLYEELIRKDKRERATQIKALVDEKIAEATTKLQNQLTELNSLVMELSSDLE